MARHLYEPGATPRGLGRKNSLALKARLTYTHSARRLKPMPQVDSRLQRWLGEKLLLAAASLRELAPLALTVRTTQNLDKCAGFLRVAVREGMPRDRF